MKSSIRYCTVLVFALPDVLHAGEAASAAPTILPSMVDVLTETWRAAEITFESAKTYPDRLNAAELNVLFTSPSGKQYAGPGFWDGGRTWKGRFAPTECGVWKYVSTCTDSSDGGLHDKRGTVGANRYQGSLEIYRHGFLRTAPSVRYFMYADGTPFFYLGDTHWSMPLEPKSLPPKDERPKWGYGVLASTSGFRDVPGHAWYGVQWTPPHESGIRWLPVKEI
ncbi:MAG: DUF5060 domain-containing protein [Verrucomicrobiota bacterium]